MDLVESNVVDGSRQTYRVIGRTSPSRDQADISNLICGDDGLSYLLIVSV